jgi:peptide/nickel transport system substrate-binding protein
VIGFHKARPCRQRQVRLAVTAALLMAAANCARNDGGASDRPRTTLSIGYGENPESGIQQTVRNIALEGLLRIDRDGRPSPWLAERWSVSPDGLTWRLQLRPGATFHNGQLATASVLRDIVAKDLREYVGPAFDDVQEVRASASYELEFVLRRRSTVLFEGLDVLVQLGETPIGTGPFSLTGQAIDVGLRANPTYYAGKPLIDRIVFKPYASVRAAWADMLRGQVDMLYEVGADALDSLRASTQTRIYPFQRSYAFLVVLNTENPKLRDKALRRALNAAIDRTALIEEALDGHGTPADGPVWPHHWAYDQDLAHFRFEPRSTHPGKDALRFTCLLTDQAHERIGLAIQRQLRAVGVELTLEQLPADQALARLRTGDFEAALGDYRLGPGLLRQYQSWYSGAPYNWGRFSSAVVNSTLDRIQRSPDDAAYKAGVADFQRAIIDDPPAIFLAWGERLRAVSTLFDVHEEPGRDILSTLRLWHPVANGRVSSPN